METIQLVASDPEFEIYVLNVMQSVLGDECIRGCTSKPWVFESGAWDKSVKLTAQWVWRKIHGTIKNELLPSAGRSYPNQPNRLPDIIHWHAVQVITNLFLHFKSTTKFLPLETNRTVPNRYYIISPDLPIQERWFVLSKNTFFSKHSSRNEFRDHS